MTEFGKIGDFKKKKNLGKGLQLAVDFLTRSDHQAVFNQLEKGSSQKVEIDGERIFAVYQKYDSKDGSKPVFEAHRKFIDVQYLHSGSELIFVSDIEGSVINQVYDEENDFELFELKQWSTLWMKAGIAAVLYPEDLHAPCILCEQSQLIEKIVVKVKLD
jgi:biofilm protein TabA